MTTITLPHPVSTNKLWRVVGKQRVIKSKAYRAWLDEAGWRLKEQKPTPVKGPVSVTIVVGKSRRDLDNATKGLLDLLVAHQIIEGDGPACVRKLNLSVDESVDGVRVTIEPYYDPDDDIRKSVNLCLATVKERMAAGGPAWPKDDAS